MKFLKIPTMLLVAFLMVQCQDETLETDQTNQEPIPEKIIVNLQNMGFDTNINPIIAIEKGYVVEGDILVFTEDILKTTTKQRRNRQLVSCRNVKNIRVKSLIGDRLGTQLRAAINQWNKVNGSFAKFKLVNSNADITIRFARNGEIGTFAGLAGFPKNGRPHNLIRLRRNALDGKSNRDKKWRSIIIHELGHAIGFHHTDTNNGVAVTGVGGRDGKSVMIAGVFNKVRTLSTKDKKALKKLYGGSSKNNLCK